MGNLYFKDETDGIFTVSELIEWLRTNCVGDELCSGIGGGNVTIEVYKDEKRIVFE